MITRLQERAAQLTEERKKKGKTMPEGLARSRDISEYKQIASLVGMHSPSIPGILCLDASKTTPERIITGGNDKNAVIFNTQASQVCFFDTHLPGNKLTIDLYAYVDRVLLCLSRLFQEFCLGSQTSSMYV